MLEASSPVSLAISTIPPMTLGTRQNIHVAPHSIKRVIKRCLDLLSGCRNNLTLNNMGYIHHFVVMGKFRDYPDLKSL